jgi:hypothetical protein
MERQNCDFGIMIDLLSSKPLSQVAEVRAHPGSSIFSLVFRCSPSTILNALGLRHPVTAYSGVTLCCFPSKIDEK